MCDSMRSSRTRGGETEGLFSIIHTCNGTRNKAWRHTDRDAAQDSLKAIPTRSTRAEQHPASASTDGGVGWGVTRHFINKYTLRTRAKNENCLHHSCFGDTHAQHMPDKATDRETSVPAETECCPLCKKNKHMTSLMKYSTSTGGQPKLCTAVRSFKKEGGGGMHTHTHARAHKHYNPYLHSSFLSHI